MKAKVVSVPLSQIRMDGGTQSRAALDEDTIAEYAAAYERGDEMPPVMLFFENETRSHWLADGFHRCAGAAKAGVKRIKAIVTPGSLRAAILFSVGANARHGLRRSNADKRRAVETLLRDAEWGAKSDRWIAETAGVDGKTVAAVRDQLRISAPEEKREARDGKNYPARRNSDAEATREGTDGRPDTGDSPGAGEGHDQRDERGRGDVDRDVGLQRMEDVRDAGANAPDSAVEVGDEGDQDLEVGEPAPPPPDPIDMRGLTASAWWLGDVDKVVSEYAGLLTHLQLALGGVKRLAGLAYHKTHSDALKAAIATALYELERRAPAAVCLACRAPGEEKSETCGVCLGCGYVVRSQVDPLVPAPKAKAFAVPPTVPSVPSRPSKSPTRNIRVVRDGVEVPYDDIPPPGDDDALEPV